MRIFGSGSAGAGAGERDRSSFSLIDRLLVVKEDASEFVWLSVTESDVLESIAFYLRLVDARCIGVYKSRWPFLGNHDGIWSFIYQRLCT